jgi:hypothetical protein
MIGTSVSHSRQTGQKAISSLRLSDIRVSLDPYPHPASP